MPLEIVGLGKKNVRFVWDEGEEDLWTARDLRLICACAHCRSEITGERLLKDDDVPAEIIAVEMHLVGNYGVNIHFSDSHTTGIYRFRDLKERRAK